MELHPKIIQYKSQKIIGLHTVNSLAKDKTKMLWQELMPRRNEVNSRIGSAVYDLKIYPEELQMQDFTPVTEFDKWAGIPVENDSTIPEGMRSYTIPEGTYAVFIHKGPASSFPNTMHKIFTEWLPQSNYQLEDRPHFEILEETYNPLDPNAEEEIWIPVKKI